MKIAIRIVIAILFLGVVFIAANAMGVFSSGIFDFLNDDQSYGDLEHYELTETITGLDLDFEYRHVIIESIEEEGTFGFSYYAHEDDFWDFSIVEGVLTIKQERHSLFSFFQFLYYTSKEKQTVTIYLPVSMIDTLNLHTDVGDINITLYTIETLDLLHASATTGDITMNDGSINDLSLTVTTGDIVFNRIDSTGDIIVRATTGDITLDMITSATLDIKATTGDVVGSQSTISSTVKIEIITGDIDLDEVDATSYDFKTTTGYISFKNYGTETYRYDLETTLSDIIVNQVSQGDRHVTTIGDRSIKARTTTGKITITAGTQ